MNKFFALIASALSIGGISASDAGAAAQSQAAVDWQVAVTEGNNRALVRFLLKHPDSEFAEAARDRLMSGEAATPAVMKQGDAAGEQAPISGLFQHI